MTARYDIIQGTVEWHEIRYGKISGTNSEKLFSGYETLKNKLIACRLEDFNWEEEDEYKNKAMLRGLEYEPEAIFQVAMHLGIQFKTCGWIQSDKFPMLGISPDAISECETIQLEVKCPGRDKHTQYIREDIVPLEYVGQCTHAFTVNDKLKALYFVSYRPESVIPLFIKEITLDSELNVGTAARPVMMIVKDRVNQIKERIGQMQKDVEKEVQKITF